MTGPIVVGYDASETSEPALARALEEATAAGTSVVVVSVAAMPFDPEGPMNYGTYTDAPKSVPLVEPSETEQILDAARARIDAAGIEADYVWEAGDVASALVREATRSRRLGDRRRQGAPQPPRPLARNGRRRRARALRRAAA